MKLNLTLTHSEVVTFNPNGETVGKMIDNRLRDIMYDDNVKIRNIELSFDDVELEAMRMVLNSGHAGQAKATLR